MEKLPYLPRSQTNIKRIKQISPTTIRILKQAVSSRDTSKFINLSSTLKSSMKRPSSEGLELSFQLTTLRKNLDKFSLLKSHKERTLKDLKSKMKLLKDSEVVKVAESRRSDEYNRLRQEIKNVQVSELEELENQRIYEFMLERLRMSKKFFEKKEKKLRKYLEKNIHEAELQAKLRKDTVDSLYQYKIVYKNAVDALKYETDSFTEEIEKIKAQSIIKKSQISKTEEHNKHRYDIIEQTMIEERSAHFEDMRNSLLMYKMYDKYLLRKLVSEKIIFNRLDDAFQKIRIKTGFNNVDEVIEKFLSQEFNYRALTLGLHNKESECNHYKIKIADIQKKVNELGQMKQNNEVDSLFIQKRLEIARIKEKKSNLEQLFLKLTI